MRISLVFLSVFLIAASVSAVRLEISKDKELSFVDRIARQLFKKDKPVDAPSLGQTAKKPVDEEKVLEEVKEEEEQPQNEEEQEKLKTDLLAEMGYVTDNKATPQPVVSRNTNVALDYWEPSYIDELVYMAWSASMSVYSNNAMYMTGRGFPYYLDFCTGASARLFSASTFDFDTGTATARLSVNAWINGTMKRIAIIATRGTEPQDNKDIAADLASLFRVPLTIEKDGTEDKVCESCGKVGSGFYKQFKSSRLNSDRVEDFSTETFCIPEDHIEGSAPCDLVIITGHSLGGSVSIIHAMELALNKFIPKDKLYLITFGAPRVGDKDFVKKIRSLIDDDHMRLFTTWDKKSNLPDILAGDIVPRMLPRWAGFERSAPLRKLFVSDAYAGIGPSAIFARHKMFVYHDTIKLKGDTFGKAICHSSWKDGHTLTDEEFGRVVDVCHKMDYSNGALKDKEYFVDSTFIAQPKSKWPGVKSSKKNGKCKDQRDCEDTKAHTAEQCGFVGDRRVGEAKIVDGKASREGMRSRDVACVEGQCRCTESWTFREPPFNCFDYETDIKMAIRRGADAVDEKGRLKMDYRAKGYVGEKLVDEERQRQLELKESANIKDSTENAKE